MSYLGFTAWACVDGADVDAIATGNSERDANDANLSVGE